MMKGRNTCSLASVGTADVGVAGAVGVRVSGVVSVLVGLSSGAGTIVAVAVFAGVTVLSATLIAVALAVAPWIVGVADEVCVGTGLTVAPLVAVAVPVGREEGVLAPAAVGVGGSGLG